MPLPDPDLKAFGEAVRARRKTLKKTQPQLANALGVTKQSVYLWEHGKGGISDELMVELAAELECEPADLAPTWTPANAGWGGRRGNSLPSPQRLDIVEAELRAVREALEAHGITVAQPATLPGQGLREVDERSEQQSSDPSETKPGQLRTNQGS